MATAGPRIPPINQTVGVNPDITSSTVFLDEDLSIFWGALNGETNVPAGGIIFDSVGNTFIINAGGPGVPPSPPDLHLVTDGAAEMLFTTNSLQRAVITSAGLVGINQAIPGSTLTVEGSQAVAVTNATVGTVTLNDTHHTIFADASGGVVVVRLPTLATLANRDRVYVIKKTDASANAVNVQAPLGITVDGVAGITALTVQYQSLTICGGSATEYFII
jgi:hypothetical protein